MKTPDFSTILDQQATDIEPPKPLPAGSYVCIVQGLPRFDKSSRKQTDFVEFTLQPVSAEDDVDADDLEDFGPLGEKTIRATFYITNEAVYRLRDFLVDLGLEIEGHSLNELINQSPGQSVIAHIVHRFSDDGKRVFAEVKSTTKYGG
jgi:hypothetical protein